MATLRDIKRKIGAVKKTAQITRAMNMVAASKLRSAQQNAERFQPYAGKFREIMWRLAAASDTDESFPLLTPREEVKKVDLIVVTADRGLCGSFNNNLLVAAERFTRERAKAGVEVTLTAAGKKASEYFRRRKASVRASHVNLLNKPSFDDAMRIGKTAIALFEGLEVDEVYILYSRFGGMMRQVPTITRLLPIIPEAGDVRPVDYLFEPGRAELLNDLLPNFVHVQILEAMYQTAVSEQAARMTSMENATNNCKELVGSLTLTYNKARQAAITTELMDIVAGAEALRK